MSRWRCRWFGHEWIAAAAMVPMNPKGEFLVNIECRRCAQVHSRLWAKPGTVVRMPT
jgi:hypothetical protein